MYKYDSQDKEVVTKYKWHKHHLGYLVTTVYLGGGRSNPKYKYLSMHRLIMGEPKHKDVDHINGDKTDNRRANLRIVSTSQNCRNQKKGLGFSSIYKGVTWVKKQQRWASQLVFNYKRFHLGTFKKEKDAALAYDDKAKQLFGEYAKLNFI